MGALTQLEPLMVELRDACAAALDPTPLRVQLSPGAMPAWDGGCGQLSVSLTGSTPNYGRQRKANGAYCTPISQRVNIAIELVRCVSTVRDQGRLPTSVELNQDTSQEIADIVALTRVLECHEFAKFKVDSVELQNWTLTGPQGGLLGITFNVMFEIMEF